jgi:hypothetical protein
MILRATLVFFFEKVYDTPHSFSIWRTDISGMGFGLRNCAQVAMDFMSNVFRIVALVGF